MIITIDGPAGAGKSSVARALARRLGYRFLDTGAMYRAIAWAVLQTRIAWDDSERIAQLCRDVTIQLTPDRVRVDGRDVTQEIRESTVTRVIHHVADNPLVREVLVEQQRREAADGNVVTEGRDQGTVVFPDAECKIYLTASAEERARRRLRDFEDRGETITFEEVLAGQNERDDRDRRREFGRLLPADDAIEVETDGLTAEQVLDELERIARARFSEKH